MIMKAYKPLIDLINCRIFAGMDVKASAEALMALNSLKSKLKYRIARSKGAVFVPPDFLDLSGRDQVGRALRELQAEGVLIRFGQGLYAKAKRSSLTNKIIPIKPLPELAEEALTRKLHVEVVTAEEQERYNAGRSTQVPTGRVIAVKGRVSRKMSWDGKSIKLQHVS